MAKDKIQSGILGDISPKPGTEDHVPSKSGSAGVHEDDMTSMDSGRNGEVGGTRNFRQSSGATGSDIGNRPE
jgi:hypothetical protein